MLTKLFMKSALALLLLILPAAAMAQTKLLRFPDIYGDKVVFTYGGDLWTAPATGGTALSLCTPPAQTWSSY